MAPNAGKLRKVGCKSAQYATERGSHIKAFISGEGAKAHWDAAMMSATRIRPNVTK